MAWELVDGTNAKCLGVVFVLQPAVLKDKDGNVIKKPKKKKKKVVITELPSRYENFDLVRAYPIDGAYVFCLNVVFASSLFVVHLLVCC